MTSLRKHAQHRIENFIQDITWKCKEIKNAHHLRAELSMVAEAQTNSLPQPQMTPREFRSTVFAFRVAGFVVVEAEDGTQLTKPITFRFDHDDIMEVIDLMRDVFDDPNINFAVQILPKLALFVQPTEDFPYKLEFHSNDLQLRDLFMTQFSGVDLPMQPCWHKLFKAGFGSRSKIYIAPVALSVVQQELFNVPSGFPSTTPTVPMTNSSDDFLAAVGNAWKEAQGSFVPKEGALASFVQQHEEEMPSDVLVQKTPDSSELIVEDPTLAALMATAATHAKTATEAPILDETNGHITEEMRKLIDQRRQESNAEGEALLQSMLATQTESQESAGAIPELNEDIFSGVELPAPGTVSLSDVSVDAQNPPKEESDKASDGSDPDMSDLIGK